MTRLDQQSRNDSFQQRRQKWGVFVLIIGLVVLGVWQSIQLGQYRAGAELYFLRDTRQAFDTRFDTLKQKNTALQEQLAIEQRAAQIDAEAYREITRNLRELESENLQQREELTFYRGIVSPAQSRKGLHIQSFELERGVLPGHFRYSLLLTQVTGNNKAIKGVVEIKISGRQGSKPLVLTLAQVSLPKRTRWDFRFRYFQTLEGQIQLPEGFLADTFDIEIKASGRREALTRSFGWPE